MEWVDELVEAVVIERLRMPDAADLLTPRPAPSVDGRVLVRLDELRARLDDAATMYAEGSIDAQQFRIVSDKLRPQIDDAERQTRPSPVSSLPKKAARIAGARDPRAVWDALDVLDRRAVLSALGVTVTINKGRQGPGFDPDSVVIGWGGEQTAD
jgi:hypothetical protein